MSDETTTKPTRLPLWRACFDEMKAAGLKFGQTWSGDFFEERLKCNRGSIQFGLGIMSLRKLLSAEPECWYLEQRNRGTAFRLLLPGEVDRQAKRDERALRRRATRAVRLRIGVLNSPEAQLTKEERAVLERGLERASFTLVLLSRQKSIAALVRKQAPKLLRNGSH